MVRIRVKLFELHYFSIFHGKLRKRAPYLTRIYRSVGRSAASA